ncbi:MAG: cytochrome C552 [Hyphomicrobiales bacterium]|nr:cytochrome C552 [Hyphomicrobiales bacterium]
MSKIATFVRNWQNWKIWGVPLIGMGAATIFVLGILFWGGFNTAMEATNTLGFCVSCHEMETTVFQEYKQTIHYQNRTGVRAVCSDCHVPKSWVHKFIRKIKASRELYHKAMGSINTPEKFEAKRLKLAKKVWHEMKSNDSRECRNCHTIESMSPEFQRPRARKQHLSAMKVGQTCIDCHKGIAHKNVRSLVSEEELELIEKPDAALALVSISQPFLDSMKRVEEKEAAEERKKLEEYAAAEVEVEERVKAEVAALLAKQDAVANSNTRSNSNDTTVSRDWSGVATSNITLFYPGQASFEWVQTGKDHGGARAFLKGGDRCATCHLKEVKDMGAKIVSGEKLEPTPIEGKRGSIDVKMQATHDNENMYLRFRWKNGKHTPVPFVDGGKMDPANQVKLTVMIAENNKDDTAEVELVNKAGCWVTCHHDSRYMPHKPTAEDMAKYAAAADRLELEDGITKYIKSSRTKIEVKGRRGKIRGGWEKLKDEAELKSLLNKGSFLDFYRYNSGEDAQNGHVASSRKMEDKGKFSATGKLEGNTWTVTIVRPLNMEQPGDISIEPGKLYTFGIAIHDDYTDARFHHVSLEYYLGMDNEEAEINVAK